MQHVRRVFALTSIALAGFASAPALANVLNVAPSGATYNSIQAAVNAAATDDVILVGPGTYAGAVTVSGKSLTICGKVGGTVLITGTTTVTNLTANQRVVLSGLRGTAPLTSQVGGDAGVGLLITNNAGSVRVESCTFTGANGWGDGSGSVFPSQCCEIKPEGVGRDGAVIRSNSMGVSLAACEFQGGRGAIPNTNPLFCFCGTSRNGGDGLRIESTLVSLYDCKCFGGRGGDNATNGGAGGAGCRTIAGSGLTGAFASGSRFQGAKGGDAWDSIGPAQGGPGGPGLHVGPSSMVHLLDNLYFGGAGGLSNFGAYPPGPAGVALGGGGSISQDPESHLVMTTERLARAGTIVDVTIQGTPGQDMYLIVSREPTFQILPSWRGTLLTQQGKGSVIVRVGRIPLNGVLQTRYQVPPLPAGVTSSTVFIQAVRSDMAAGPKLAAGTSITLLH